MDEKTNVGDTTTRVPAVVVNANAAPPAPAYVPTLTDRLTSRKFLGSVVVSALIAYGLVAGQVSWTIGLPSLSALWGLYNLGEGIADHGQRG